MRRFHRYFWSFVLLLAGVFVLLPRQHPGPNPESIPPEQEISVKQNILQNDVQLTDELCRRQCLYDFRQTVQQLEPFGAPRIRQALAETQSQHPHIKQLIWVSHADAAAGNESISVGQTDERIRAQANAYLEEAKNAVRSGSIYESDPIRADGHVYFVLGVPAEDGKSSLIGVVHQEILHKVADHQNKNLRIVPYPADHHWKMESVDADTLQDVKVDHPEQNEGTSHYHKNEVVVKFRQHPSDAELKQMQEEIHASSVRKLDHTYVFQSRDMEAKQLMNYFQKWNVEYAEPHFLYLTNTLLPPPLVPRTLGTDDTPPGQASLGNADIITPNDVLYRKYQWNLPIIDTELGWNISKGAGDVPVGIVDTGVDMNHPDLKDHLMSGYNVVDASASPMDDVGHGTHVAGVVAAIVNNNRGVAGMTWMNPVLPVKVLDHTGAGNTYAVAEGIIWAADHGAKVINLSLGNYADANFLHDAIKYAFDKDVVIVAASGNDNTEKPGYPAAYPEVLAVAATDANKNRASFSNFGDYIDVAAPGVGIASTYPDNQYAALSGTSMASPHVTALAALIRSVNPLLKNTEVMDIIRQTAEDLGPAGKDKFYGYGQIDVVKALQAAMDSKNTTTYLPRWLSRVYDQLLGRYGEP